MLVTENGIRLDPKWAAAYNSRPGAAARSTVIGPRFQNHLYQGFGDVE